ncbi:hypothetical protein Hte_007288 [Hypoxylon texense]
MSLSSFVEACVPSTFAPSFFGAEILSIQASVVSNFTAYVDGGDRYTAPSVRVQDASFCNVTVTYTHPGYEDKINAEAWLPIDNWNGRFLAHGGGGHRAGRFPLAYQGMAGAIHDGFATITTDAGLEFTEEVMVPWALLSPGNVNLHKLQNLASIGPRDLAIIGKSLIKSFYGRPPSYSYWNGCSQGGRQGLMLAQRYPTAFDGIAAVAPAVYWSETLFNIFWPEQVMRMLGEYPHMCELDAITAAAISKCDGLDGVTDGIVAEVDECRANFNPFDLVGTVIPCAQANANIPISRAAAAVANASWGGIVSPTGEQLWYGLSIDADLTCNGRSAGQLCVASTKCTNGNCVPLRNPLGSQWIQHFVAKDSNFNLDNVTHEQFIDLLRASQQQYTSIIGTSDPDLSEFKKAGGKMLTYHGADSIIPLKHTEVYYGKVSEVVDGVQDFYRFFPVPGLGHCMGGYQQPTSLFAQLQAWVENGTAPESSPVSFSGPDGVTQNRILCPWPRKARFNSSCGDAAKAECWSCLAQSNHGEPSLDEVREVKKGAKKGKTPYPIAHLSSPGIQHQEL